MSNCNYRRTSEVVVIIIYICLQISAVAVLGEEAVVEQQVHVGFQIACLGGVTEDISSSGTLKLCCPCGSQSPS